MTCKPVTLLHGDAATVLAELPAKSIHCCVTSPPYFGLRDYGVDGQLGQEKTVDDYIANLLAVFAQVRRVLRGDGTLWLNLGDTLAAKQLLGVPWRVAFALQDAGWILRSEIIWHKPSTKPESARDRPTKAHEYVFLLAKQPRYFYDAEAVKEPTRNLRNLRNLRDVWTVATHPYKGAHFAVFPPKLVEPCIKAGTSERGCCSFCGSPYKRQVERVRVPTRPGNAAEYKTTDPQRHVTETKTIGWQRSCKCELGEPVPCSVLDPFCGSGTAGLVARQLGRSFIGVDLNAEYLSLAENRIAGTGPTARRSSVPEPTGLRGGVATGEAAAVEA